MRTGKVDFGQSTVHTAYRQLVAEELRVSYDAITTVVMGDTDRTPDGGFSAGYLEYGGQNLRKAAAYTYQALLDLAATALGADTSQLTVENGVVSGGGRRVTYGELVRGHDLELTIPVEGDLTSIFGLTVVGDPPLKPTSSYTVVGKSFPNAVTPGKVTGTEAWVTNVRLPNMLHGRIIHPQTLGSKLIAAGAVDKAQCPTARVVVKGNLVGVVAATEWEAITAARSVAGSTKWSEWKGLPGHAKVHAWMRDRMDWTKTPVAQGDKNGGDTGAAFGASAKSLAADDRLIGAIIAGLPTPPAPTPSTEPLGSTYNSIQDPWLYDRVANVAESGLGTFQVGPLESPLGVGLRDHSMRTPGQLQQNYPRELAMSEAAALAGQDPIEFRLTHTTDTRLSGVLTSVREASGWQTRPSPAARATPGATPLKGQGVSVMLRSGTYWACVCHVSVAPAAGRITVDKYTIAVDPGIVINPLQLKRQIEGGALMGLSHALYEEMTFDESAVTSRDWRTYPVLTMADVPDVKVVILPHPEVGMYGGGSEAANALAVSAIAAAFHDATGTVARRLPLTPTYVQSILKA